MTIHKKKSQCGKGWGVFLFFSSEEKKKNKLWRKKSVLKEWYSTKIENAAIIKCVNIFFGSFCDLDIATFDNILIIVFNKKKNLKYRKS